MRSFIQWLENLNQNPFPNSSVQQIVYHGTDKPFDTFNYQQGKRFILFSQFDVEAKGFFFAESPHEALEYGRYVAKCFIDLKNPLVDPRRDKNLGVDGFDKQKELHLLKILGPLIQKDKNGFYFDLGVRRVWITPDRYNFAYEWIYEVVDSDGVNWDILDNPLVVQRMVALGYDGTFVQEPQSHIGRSIFVVKPEQVKILGWVNGVQRDWGHKDDYFVQKQNGFRNFVHEPSEPEYEDEEEY